MKVLIFDSGALINLSMNGLLYVLEDLKKDFDGKFIITNQVRYEIVERPMGIQKFELGALSILKLIEDGTLEMSSSLGVDDSKIVEDTKVLMEKSNRAMRVKGEWVHLVEEAEMSCLALSNILSNKKIESLIAIDERTTRMLCENPGSLSRIMSEKLHQRVEIVAEDFQIFEKVRFIRSSEIVYVAYKKNIVKLKGKKVLEALLYATKYKGSSISFKEIDIMKKL